MSVSPLDLLAAQLRASSPGSDWGVQGVDRARELAAMFIRAGVFDLQNLSLQSVDIWECFRLVGRAFDPLSQSDYDRMPAVADLSLHSGEHQGVSPDPAFSFEHYLSITDPVNGWYDYRGNKKRPVDVLETRDFLPIRFVANGRPFGFLGDTNRDGGISGGSPLLRIWNQAVFVAWSSRGNGNVTYLLFLTPEKTFRFHPVWQSSRAGDRAAIREVVTAAVMIGTLGYAFAGAGSLGSALGEQIVSAQFAAAYPGVTSAIGNVALSTAVNGGDVEAAVKQTIISAGTGFVGVQVGQQVAQVTDIDALGRIAQAAATAYIRGGDVESAVAMAALQSIPDAFPSAFQESPSMNLAPLSISDWPAANDWQVAADPWGVSSLPGFAAPEFQPLPSVLDFTTPAPVFTTDAPAGGNSGGWWRDTFTRENVRAVRDVVTDVAAIVGTVRAVESMNDPRAAPTPRAAVQNPIQTIRNPDGSLTRVAPDGSVQVISAEQARRIMNPGLQLSPTVLALGGAALLGVLFFATRKR